MATGTPGNGNGDNGVDDAADRTAAAADFATAARVLELAYDDPESETPPPASAGAAPTALAALGGVARAAAESSDRVGGGAGVDDAATTEGDESGRADEPVHTW